MASLLILGKGGYGMVVKEAAEAMGGFERIAFLDDNAQSNAIGSLNDYLQYKNDFTHAYAAFGKNSLRMAWLEKLSEGGFALPVLVHPRAYVSPSAILNDGACILANAVVGAGAVIDVGAIVNVCAIADHHCVINKYVHLAPGAIVKAGCTVERMAKIESGEVVFKAY